MGLLRVAHREIPMNGAAQGAWTVIYRRCVNKTDRKRGDFVCQIWRRNRWIQFVISRIFYALMYLINNYILISSILRTDFLISSFCQSVCFYSTNSTRLFFFLKPKPAALMCFSWEFPIWQDRYSVFFEVNSYFALYRAWQTRFTPDARSIWIHPIWIARRN